MATFHLKIKSGSKGAAANHGAYIGRTGRYAKEELRGHLIAAGHGNLPTWANGDPIKFWKAADKNERKNGATYREFEMALPRELDLEQQLELVERFIWTHAANKPYQYAIHAPIAALEGNSQPHVHLMVSDRLLDEFDRPPEQLFMRHNPWHPERGGAKKDSGGKSPTELRQHVNDIRASWASMQNSALERFGHRARVDHRSYKERGISRTPERHFGNFKIRTMTDEIKSALIKNRI
jgi:hypothetical protein